MELNRGRWLSGEALTCKLPQMSIISFIFCCCKIFTTTTELHVSKLTLCSVGAYMVEQLRRTSDGVHKCLSACQCVQVQLCRCLVERPLYCATSQALSSTNNSTSSFYFNISTVSFRSNRSLSLKLIFRCYVTNQSTFMKYFILFVNS